MLKNIVGSVVRGGDFYGRDRFVEQLWQKLETTNVLLASPRRFGKTSVMYRLLDSPKLGYHVIHFDLEPVTEPVDFVVTLLDKLRENQKLLNLIRFGAKNLRTLLGNFEVTLSPAEGVDFRISLKEKLRENWREIGTELLKQMEESQEKILLVFDEFTIMIENFLDDRLKEKDVREFLHWFRSARIAPNMTKSRFLIGSSISIEHHLSKLRVAATLNDFEKMVLGEFDDSKIAGQFVEEVFEDKAVQIGKTAKQRILQLIGPPIPYFIQILVSEVIKKFGGTDKKVKQIDVEAIYLEAVLGVSCKSYFQHYYDRLLHYSKPNERAAKALLKNLAIAGEVAKSALYQQYLQAMQQKADIDGFNDLMSDLENDFYIKYQPDSQSYIFFSKILQDWWARYYSL